MSDTEKLISLLTQQIGLQRQQMEQQQQQMEQQKEESKRMMEQQKEESRQMIRALLEKDDRTRVTTPSFPAFDPNSEIWTDYLARFNTFLGANSVTPDKEAQIFLTNQSPIIYKQLSDWSNQQTPKLEINKVDMDVITNYMNEQYNPRRFIIRERHRFWSDMKRKPGETIQELAARIRHDASTCDFSSIKDVQDEALRTKLICSVGNEAVLKAIFKMKDEEVTFNKAIEIASATEEAAKVAKETAYGTTTPVHQLNKKPARKMTSTRSPNQLQHSSCYRCGKTTHTSNDCRFKNAACNFCKITGHIEVACRKKMKSSQQRTTSYNNNNSNHKQLKIIRTLKTIHSLPRLRQDLMIGDQQLTMEIDTGAGDNFLTDKVWQQLGCPALEPSTTVYESASKHPINILGTCHLRTRLLQQQPGQVLHFVVSTVPNLNLLGRNGIQQMGLSVDALMSTNEVRTVRDVTPDESLQKACKQVASEFPDLFKDELGCLKDFQLEVKFREDAQPIFCKPRPVPFALQEELSHAYDAGVARGVWEPIQFSSYGTPVVPIRKSALPGEKKRKLRVCGDYSVTINPQLETHRHPIPLPEDLMRKLGGGYGFTKIDLADAYSQIQLGPESQKKLALSTHRGVLLQKRLPFGISSACSYFQEIMEQLTQDLQGVAIYLDDILISGMTAEDHLKNLRALLQRLQDHGMRCRPEKCSFAEAEVEYLGHKLSRHGIAKGAKVEAVRMMPAPTDVKTLHSFLGSIQFYNKFLPDLSTIAAPLHQLLKKGEPWHWGSAENTAFNRLKDALCMETTLAHFDPSMDIGIACDASEVGLGVVLFHRYKDGREQPLAYASKTLTDAQKAYGQVQKEALSIVFALKKFHQFLYGRRFILITDHKPLLALFGPTKATPAMAANRLARWALTLNQYDYSIEYRKTADHDNADSLSRLPAGPDINFDREEDGEDMDTVCTINTISSYLNPTDPGVLKKETAKDPVLSTVMRHTTEGWPRNNTDQPNRNSAPTQGGYRVEDFKRISSSLSVSHGCLLYGARVVIPLSLQRQVLQILHLGHFGIQRMKHLARTSVYWPRIDRDIQETCQQCTSCAEHQNKPEKAPNHPWMMPEKPWSRLHIDHAIDFMGTNWLVMVDAYTKYPCIHPTTSISTKATTDLLEQDFAHFGYPHTIVSDNGASFTSEEFQQWCKERGITHLTGAPYHPATNGAAERLVQTFKQAVKKSTLSSKQALQEFLMQYRRTPLPQGFSPSELLNGRQLRCKIDTLLPSPAHLSQRHQMQQEQKTRLIHDYQVGTPCYALYCGPRRNQQPKWIPATIIKVLGSRTMNVRVLPRGPVWKRHIEQLCKRYSVPEDDEPPDDFTSTSPPLSPNSTSQSSITSTADAPSRRRRNPRLPDGDEYGRHNPRRSNRLNNR